MNKLKIIIWTVLVVFIVIQFFRPDRNLSNQVYEQSIKQLYQIPDKVNNILQRSCMNCHSNNTEYPWYANVQPFDWLLEYHIRKGKKELNLDEFARYSKRMKISKLRAMKSQVKDGEMPLPAYARMHEEARLSDAEKNRLINWLVQTIDSLKTTE